MFLIVYYLIVSALAAKCSTTQANCDGDNCEMVGATQICTRCEATFVPIDGQCQNAENSKGKCTNADGNAATQVCEKCKDQTFMYKGGCYPAGSGTGKTMCKAATEGKCTEAASDSYFLVPAADTDASTQSVVSCGDSEGATAKGDKKYKGVDGCKTCTLSSSTTTATCKECATDLYLKTEASGTSCVASDKCTGGFFPMTDTADSKKLCTKCDSTGKGGVAECTACVPRTDDPTKAKCTACDKNKKPSLDGLHCYACTVDNCASCNSKGACQKCTNSLYLKTETDGATSCVAECPDGYFGHTATGGLKTCQSCATEATLDPAVTGIPGCTQCTYATARASTLKCTACGGGKKPNKEGTGCFDCSISGCAYCSEAGKCEECGSGYKLEGEACVPAGTNLSTGAIAGISVAAVVVVGGLVGFLCWWFICRGKA